MHIINAMFGRKLGGIEQSFVDYCLCLKTLGYKVTALTYPKAPINKQLAKLNINIVSVKNIGQYDVFAKSYLKKMLKQASADAIIAHGNRAINLLEFSKKKFNIPLIAVTHNYKLKHIHKADYIFATTSDLKQKVLNLKFEESKIFTIPNMVQLPQNISSFKEFNDPLVIGTMGRLIDIKGYDYFIKALAILKNKNINFKVKMAGDGEELDNLKQLAEELNLTDKIDFLGWVDDKQAFFSSIDIFCMTSLTEAFGIALVEAFSYGKLVITSDAQGPAQIATNLKDAIIIPKENSSAISDAIIQLASDINLCSDFSQNALKKSKEYSFENVSKILDSSLNMIINT